MKAIVLLALVLAGCGAAFRPFASRPIVWRDDDAQPFAGPPPLLYTPWAWEMGDNAIFRPMSQAFLYERPSEAIDVNALDEVPDSSWYTNRLSRHALSTAALVRGACPDAETPPPPYVVVQGKEGGSSPGAVIEASDGHRYMMKTDLFGQPERGTAADAIATRFLYAAGYDVPCNVVVYVTRADLRIADDAMSSHGSSEPYTEARLTALLDAATEGPDGTRRISLSRFIDGELLGGFHFSGVRDEDPNDAVPHEHRRELRAFYLVSAWLNHIDVRPENNIDVWTATSEGRGYIHHMILDAGDSLGIVWDADVDLGMSRRFGNAHYLDMEQIVGDIASLGLLDRGYRDPVRGPAFEVLGFFDVERFDPGDWRSGYSNPAFEHRTERDLAWMARILARLGEPEVRAIVDVGRLSSPRYADELVRILMGRRARILERFLVRLSPLSFPSLVGDSLCLRDLAVESGMRSPSERVYSARSYVGLPPVASSTALGVRVYGSRVCVPSSDEQGDVRYRIIDLVARTSGDAPSHPARVHIATSARGVRSIVGLERPDDDDAP